jgi:hypothetical protein
MITVALRPVFRPHHRPQPRFQSAVATLDPVVRMPERVVQRLRQQFFDHVRERGGAVVTTSSGSP